MSLEVRFLTLVSFVALAGALATCGPRDPGEPIAALPARPDAAAAGGQPALPGSVAGSGGVVAPAAGSGGAAGSARSEEPAAGGGGGGVDAPEDSADPAPDGDPPADASVDLRSDAGKWWIEECPAGADRAGCCTLYCGCMKKNCASEEPTDCQSACEAAKNWDLTCRTYQCFESLNPRVPQDHDSHCKHGNGKDGKCTNK